MMLTGSLLFSVMMAVLAIQTRKMRNAVIYLCAFSLSMSLVYLLYHAPDVALAEAVIGSAISTILYLVALQKYKILTFFYRSEDTEVRDEHYQESRKTPLIKLLEKFAAKQELELQIIHTLDHYPEINEKHPNAFLLEEAEGYTRIYGHPENNLIDALEDFLIKEGFPKASFTIVKVEDTVL